MNLDRINFISAYCDRWCERCTFTSRCSSYALMAATAMCDGDLDAAIELAVGAPQPVALDPEPAWRANLAVCYPSPDELRRCERERRERDTRIGDIPLMKLAWATSILACRWLAARGETGRSGRDAVLNEALEVASRTSAFVGMKIRRALHGRDSSMHENGPDDDPVQNDWNGSAKVAILALERCEAAWRVIAQLPADDTPTEIAVACADLQRMMRTEFPHAMRFVRPGFDQAGR